MNTELMFSSKTPEWATPQDLFDQLHAEFNFTLDAAATPENTKLSSYYALAHPDPERRDGLAAPWTGRVWCNPPYGRGIREWVHKAWEATFFQEAEVVVMLLPARTDTQWFHRLCRHADVRFIEGRLTFGGAPSPAPFPSMVVVFRGRPARGAYEWMER